MTTKPNDFGIPDKQGVRRFNREPLLIRRNVRPIGVNWECPMDGCTGGMVAFAIVQPMTNPPEMMHRCDRPGCGFEAAVAGHRYPEIQYEDIE